MQTSFLSTLASLLLVLGSFAEGAAAAASTVAAQSSGDAARKPNIVFILADDKY